ncbi:hypothetical protein L484_001341 [Morus notabilis]|uniref:Uncharacterized protein n=1 Tax=Morus notabilis TaxID=981085 RepID=W9SA77_9ROSA|nr:hypothetical protein L484_001341 [Morus notabilis]
MNKEGLGGSGLGRLVLSKFGRIWAWKGGGYSFAVVFGCFLAGGVWFGLRFISRPLDATTWVLCCLGLGVWCFALSPRPKVRKKTCKDLRI